MKNIKNLLLAGFIFSMASVCAIDTTTVSQVAVVTQESADEVTKFKELMQEVLRAEKPSVLKRSGLAYVRQVAQIITFFVGVYYGDSEEYKQSNRICMELPRVRLVVCAAAMFATSIMTNTFIRCKDDVLESLKKLEKHIRAIDPAQKEKIIELFTQEYSEKLLEKLGNEKDSNKLVSARFMCEFGIYLIILLGLLNGTSYFQCGQGKNNKIAQCGLAVCFGFNLYNFYKHPNMEKSRVLTRIQMSLTK